MQSHRLRFSFCCVSGLPRGVASSLAVDTVRGAAELARARAHVKTIGELKEETIWPGGATIMGVATLDQYGFRNAGKRPCVYNILPRRRMTRFRCSAGDAEQEAAFFPSLYRQHLQHDRAEQSQRCILGAWCLRVWLLIGVLSGQ